jgi:hypothetical protein
MSDVLFWSHFVVLLKSDLGVQQTLLSLSEASLLSKSSCLAAALGVAEFTTVIAMILAALCCAGKVRLRCSSNQPQIEVC